MHRPTDDRAERVDSVNRADGTDGVAGADRVAPHHVAEGDTAARADIPEMPQMAIIMENTLSAIALRGLLSDMVPGIEVVCYRSLEEYREASPVVAHHFVSAEIAFRNPDLFQSIMRRTIVITEGSASPFRLTGYRTIDATMSEKEIVRAILQIHSSGHPASYAPHTHAEGCNAAKQSNIQLSLREKEVLALVVKGYINKEIADRLNISLATVIFHRNNISLKLNTRSIGRLTIYAVLNNIVALSEI